MTQDYAATQPRSNYAGFTGRVVHIHKPNTGFIRGKLVSASKAGNPAKAACSARDRCPGVTAAKLWYIRDPRKHIHKCTQGGLW